MVIGRLIDTQFLQRALLACLILIILLQPSLFAATGTELFAKNPISRYWAGFVDYWSNIFRSQSAVVLAVLGTGAVSLFIITRGKWRK